MVKVKGSIYFLGIGGIGMSALARYFRQQGYAVYGYDLHRTPLTSVLENEGMHIHYQPAIDKIPEKLEKVIYTPAIPESNAEFAYLQEKGIAMMKRAEAIGEISQNLTTLAVAGTHGKTSITAMLAHILQTAGLPFIAFIGGISKNFGSNFVNHKNPEYLVVEADEFDRSFLQLHPDKAIITSIDADHLDIYSDIDDLRYAFKQFALKVGSKGTLIYHQGLIGFEDVGAHKISYGLGENTAFAGKNMRIESGHFYFELWNRGHLLTEIKMQVPGRHYIENAIAAAAMAISSGIEVQTVKKALETFAGVERRFDYRINESGCVYIDDYAHHPAELRATLEAVRTLYPEKKITAIFQPHLYSRTRDFADGFAKALSLIDRIILLEIYPAREKPIPGVTSRLIYDKIEKSDKYLMTKTELLQFLQKEKPEVVLSLGAGDIGLMVQDIEQNLIAE